MERMTIKTTKIQCRTSDDGYAMLAQAVVEYAIHDYKLACMRIAEKPKSRMRQQAIYNDIKMYRQNRDFLLNNCDGMVSADGEEILKAINKRFGIDQEYIEQYIADYEAQKKAMQERKGKRIRRRKPKNGDNKQNAGRDKQRYLQQVLQISEYASAGGQEQ